jgi:Helicase associated domain
MIFSSFDVLRLGCTDELLRMCLIIVQGGLDRAPSAVASPSINLPINGSVARPARNLSWDQRIAEYKHKKENDLPIGAVMRAWMSRLRTANANGTLSREYKEKLDGVGFEWSVRAPHDHDAWNRNFAHLKKHHLENLSCHGPYDDKRLEQWVYNQRARLKGKTSLDEIYQERWARLNALGFWDATDVQFERTRSDESDLVPTAHAAAACARPALDGECKMRRGQQRSGIVRVTVSVIARDLLNGAIHLTRNQA